jgi:hypothetical protein
VKSRAALSASTHELLSTFLGLMTRYLLLFDRYDLVLLGLPL